MKDLTNFISVQTRTYAEDSFPIARLLIASVGQRIIQHFAFKQGNLDNEKSAIQLGLGEFVHGNETHLIEALVFEDRRIALKVHGPTSVVTDCYNALLAIMREVDIAPSSEPLATREDASVVATLDFDFREMFAPAVSNFLDNTFPKAIAVEATDIAVVPRSFSVDVLYQERGTGGLERYTTRAPRKLIIEPRLQTALDERRFFCSAPTDTDTLVRLVRVLEADVIAARKHR